MSMFVYFIRDKRGPIKIGTAVDPYERLNSLQVGNPYPLELAGAVPYGAIARACRELLSALLCEPAHRLEPWKQRLSDAVEPNGSPGCAL